MPTSQHWVFWSIFLPFCWISYCIIKSSSYSYNPLVFSKKIHLLILKNSDKKSTIVKPWGSKAIIRKVKYISKFLYKALFVSARIAISKKQKYFSLPDHMLLKILILVFSLKEQKEDKNEFAAKFERMTIAALFAKNCFSNS